MAYKRILVPVDGSPTSTAGVKAAIKLARERGATLHLVHVIDEYAAFGFAYGGVNIGPMIDALRAEGKKLLARSSAIAARSGLKVQTRMVENFGQRIADGIIDEAKRCKAELIVMGTHGRRGIKRVLLGSDAEVVVRHSPVPVLLVPAPGRGRR